MNILMHLLLSGPDPELLVGNLMGDFVKGRLDERFPPGIRRGLELHRGIDVFAAGNEVFRRSRQRLDPAFGHYRGVLVDLYYDHFLATAWDDYSPLSLADFLRQAYADVQAREEHLPERLRTLLPGMFAELLPSYVELVGIDRALGRMARRLSRPNPLAEGGRELRRHYVHLRDDFRRFYPQVAAYVEGVDSQKS
ncbi:MAG TPA: ACP phosphodiesterase [Geobacteraceae bacterium]